MKQKTDMVKFRGRKQSPRGIAALCLGLLALIGFTVIAVISGQSGGSSGVISGLIGVVLLVITAIGFVLSIKSLQERDIFMSIPITSMVINSVMTIFLICLYIMGI